MSHSTHGLWDRSVMSAGSMATWDILVSINGNLVSPGYQVTKVVNTEIIKKKKNKNKKRRFDWSNEGIRTDDIGNRFGVSSSLLAQTGFGTLQNQEGNITIQPWGNNGPIGKPLKGRFRKNIHLLMRHIGWSKKSTKTDKAVNIYMGAWPQSSQISFRKMKKQNDLITIQHGVNNGPSMKQFEEDYTNTNNSLLPGNLRGIAPKTSTLVGETRSLVQNMPQIPTTKDP